MSSGADETAPYDDPGWPIPGRTPGAQMDGLIVLRLIYLLVLGGGLLLGVVLLLIYPTLGDPGPFLILVVGLGIAGVLAARFLGARRLDASSPESLVMGYRNNFFIGFASSEMPLLVGALLTFVENGLWPYLVALPFYLVGMWTIAPSKAHLARKQEQIYQAGSMLSLGRALSGSTHST